MESIIEQEWLNEERGNTKGLEWRDVSERRGKIDLSQVCMEMS